MAIERQAWPEGQEGFESPKKVFHWKTFEAVGVLAVKEYEEKEGYVLYDDADDLESSAPQKPEKKKTTQYYYDLFNRQLILGQEALNIHLETGAHPGIYELADLLLTDTVERLGIKREQPRAQGWGPEDCLNYAKWLVSIVEQKSGEKILNKDILNRAYQLGLGISPDQVIRLAGSLGQLYTELNLPKAKRSKVFDNVGLNELARKLTALGRDLKRKPTEQDVINRSRKKTSFPSEAIFAGRFGSLREAMEYAGWPNIYAMSNDDHIHHGVKFMFANAGMEPTQTAWDYFSKLKRGPSASILRYRFEGGFSEFKARVKEAYIKEEERRENLKRQKLNRIVIDVATNHVPEELFEEGLPDSEAIARHARYLVLDEVSPGSFYKSKLRIAKQHSATFISSTRHINKALTAGEIESVAVALGVFDDIWVVDNYMEYLKLPDEYFNQFIRDVRPKAV